MYTYRGTNEISAFQDFSLSDFDKTSWFYDEATGLLTNKLYADGNGTSYTYTPDGRLATRVWARGITTTYSHDPCCGAITNISYSDGTPSISFTHDRLGRQTQITDAQGTRTFSFDPSTLALTNETIVAGGVTSVIARTQDSYGRPSGLSFGDDYKVDYGYSGVGRFESVDSVVLGVTNNWQYSYLNNSELIESLVESNAGVTNSRAYEANRNLLTEIHNQAQGSTISKYAYQNDALGRRTQRIDTTASVTTNNFGYDARSQLTNAIMGADSFAWTFDNIGNRDTYTTNGTTHTYLANELNQYTNIANGTTEEPTYDLDGNTVTYKGWTLVWNGENRIQSASNGSTVVSFQYDYMGRRFS
jgi:YD repeat-containing protein